MATILFDLDGTLIDSSRLVLPAFKEAFRHYPQYPVPSDDTMLKTFGMPDDEIWHMLMPLASDAERSQAFAYAERSISTGIHEVSILLPHAREVLEALHQRGHVLTVASNCGGDYLSAVLDGQHIRSFFTNPLCLGLVHGKKKADILTEHFKRFSKEDAVMIGDRKSDVEAAKAHGILCVGCAFGFAAEELSDADVVISDLRELLPLFPEGSSTL